jgi:hypothetical protein
MIRNLKMLVLAAFALLAMGALFAGSASAVTVTETAETDEVRLFSGSTSLEKPTVADVYAVQYGEKTDNAFHVGEQSLHCEDGSSTFTGKNEEGGTSTHLKITPSYKDCYVMNASHGVALPATVTTNGCYYTFEEPVTDGESETTFEGDVSVVCGEGKAIEVEIYLFGGVTSHSLKVCTETIGSQTLGGVTYHNNSEGALDDITATIDTGNESIKINRLNSACPGGAGEGKARYTGQLTLTSDEHDLALEHLN